MFRSATTSDALSAENAVIKRYSFPRQLPKGITEEQVVTQAQTASGGLTGLVII